MQRKARKWILRLVAILLVIALFAGVRLLSDGKDVLKATSTWGKAEDYRGLGIQGGRRTDTYAAYLGTHAGDPTADDELTLSAGSAEGLSGGASLGTAGNRPDVLLLPAGSAAEWRLTVEEPGMYGIHLDYMALPGNGLDIEAAFEIDGRSPYLEAGQVALGRVWREDASGRRTDNQGNQIRAPSFEEAVWQSVDIRDLEGFDNRTFELYLTAGEHVFRFEVARESVAVSSLTLSNSPPPKTNEELLAEYDREGRIAPTGVAPVIVEAEDVATKSDTSLTAQYDRSGPGTQPKSPSRIVYNTFGGYGWRYSGQWVAYRVEVPEDGLYSIGARYRQNFLRGIEVSRRVTVDGALPSDLFETAGFPFSVGFRADAIRGAGNEPLVVFLTKGPHEIRLEACLGPIGDILSVLDQTVYECNQVYRKIIVITGVTPDRYSDYDLDKEIPGLELSLRRLSLTLIEQAKALEAETGTKGGEAAFLYEAARQMAEFVEKPETIATRLDQFKNNIGALGAILLRLKEQPLEMDRLYLVPAGAPMPEVDSGVLSTLAFRSTSFVSSFVDDYNSLGDVYTGEGDVKPIEVWVSANDLATSGVSSGRDQAQVIKSMIDDTFVKQTGIPVNLTLVDSNATLTQAIIGGKGPDVAMIVPEGSPVNLAMRGALADLSKMPGFEESKTEFFESAFIPYRYARGVYALPETQNFWMMFYRKDVFADLGIEPPETWEEFYRLAPRIQKSNLQVGFPESTSFFETLLLQQGGSFYNKTLTGTGFDSPQALDAFKEWTGFYAKYSFPLYFDAYNRFRTGEMPLMLNSYTFYNLLTVAAPEIRNLWDMVPIPGVRRPDGTVSRRQSCSGTCTILLESSKNKENAFRFMRWWVGADAQAAFGNGIETLMGPSARYNTANRIAFERLPWSMRERRNIMEQWQEVWDVENIPGNYYVYRMLTNAFRRVVYNNDNPRETLNRYDYEINLEIERKLEEFGIGGQGENGR